GLLEHISEPYVRLLRRPSCSNYLNQRHQIGRVTPVGAERTRTVAQALHDLGDRDHRGVAGEDRMWPRVPLDLDEQLLLQRQIFEHGLDDIVRLAHRGGKIAGWLHTVDRGNVVTQITKIGENARLGAVK